jgi:leader peptidase (prepilin peptidase)/N-methyltransferase
MRNLIPLLVLVGFGARLSAIDLKVHRLPNQLVAWFTAIQLATLIALSLDDFNELKTPLLVAVGTTAIYLILFILSRGALGLGDVKFAFPLGLCVGWYSANQWLVAIFVSFLIAGLVSVIGLVTKRITRKSRLAFGPYMFLGTFLVCVFEVL